MSIQELKQVSDELNSAKKKAQEFATTKGREIVGQAFFTVFERFPELHSFSWRQYTPYFNDGEECIFGVRGTFLIPASDKDGDKWDHEYSKWSKPEGISTECLAAVDEVWSCLSEDLLKDIFGDHVEVKVTKGSVTVTECDHD